jgi:hypothetical protein
LNDGPPQGDSLCHRQPRHACLHTTTTHVLTRYTGTHEGLHLARACHGGDEQEGCIPRNRGLMPKLIALLPISSTTTLDALSAAHRDTSLAGTLPPLHRCEGVRMRKCTVSRLHLHGIVHATQQRNFALTLACNQPFTRTSSINNIPNTISTAKLHPFHILSLHAPQTLVSGPRRS